MSRGDRHPGYRPWHAERKLLSLQDWYGLGALAAITGEYPERGIRYLAQRAVDDQFYMGFRHALAELGTDNENEGT